MTATWKKYDTKSSPAKKAELPPTVFAFPDERKEPLTDASHVRNAIARFNQVKGVTDAARETAFANLKKAAKHFKVEMTEKSWRDLGKAKD